MNYDITFCQGEGCSRKEKCRRYRELLRFRAYKGYNAERRRRWKLKSTG